MEIKLNLARKYIVLMFGIFLISSAASAQEEKQSNGVHVVGAFASYSNLLFNDHFLFDDIPNFYTFDEVNDTYEAKGINNWRAGLSYQHYFGDEKLYALNVSGFYSTRNAELTANARFLVRDPDTKEIGQLMTVSTINTYFNSVYLQAGATAFVPITDDFRVYSTFSLFGGKALNNTSADFKSEIVGFIPDGQEEPTETSLVFSRTGTKTITFKSDDETGAVSEAERDVFQNAIMGSEMHFGFDIAFGIEWFFADQFGMKLEASGSAELLDYFEKKDSGILSNMFATFSLVYAL
jgi:hypothetical protein